MQTMAFLGLGGQPGAGEMLLVFFVFLLLFGAKKLPEMARSLGKAMEHFRKAAQDVKSEFINADREISSEFSKTLSSADSPEAGPDDDTAASGDTDYDYAAYYSETGEPLGEPDAEVPGQTAAAGDSVGEPPVPVVPPEETPAPAPRDGSPAA